MALHARRRNAGSRRARWQIRQSQPNTGTCCAPPVPKGQLHRSPPLKVLLRKAVDVAKIRQPRLQRGVIPVPPLAAFDAFYQRIVKAHADLLAATPATML